MGRIEWGLWANQQAVYAAIGTWPAPRPPGSLAGPARGDPRLTGVRVVPCVLRLPLL